MYLSRMQRFILYCLLFVRLTAASAQSRTDAFLENLVRSNASPALLRVLDKPDSFHYQLIYTRIDRDRHIHDLLGAGRKHEAAEAMASYLEDSENALLDLLGTPHSL